MKLRRSRSGTYILLALFCSFFILRVPLMLRLLSYQRVSYQIAPCDVWSVYSIFEEAWPYQETAASEGIDEGAFPFNP